jgi:hypothetical protein
MGGYLAHENEYINPADFGRYRGLAGRVCAGTGHPARELDNVSETGTEQLKTYLTGVREKKMIRNISDLSCERIRR